MPTTPSFLVAAGLLLTTSLAFAQSGPSPATQAVSVEPIQCWWRTSASAVRVGDTFSLVLTCAVIETVGTTVVPDQSRLDPSVVQLVPFEVTGGSHAADLKTAAQRFFQYEYTLRYIGEDFGRDVPLPSLVVPYRVQSRVSAESAAIETRDRNYTLPPHQVRILSLVPFGASDIRDRAPDTFKAIEARQFRASMLDVTGLALLAVGGLLLVWGAVRAVSRRERKTQRAVALAPDYAVMAAVVRALNEVARARQSDGWTADLAQQALAPLRIAAAYAVQGHASQTPRTRTTVAGEGRLVVTSPLRPGRAAAVSGAATARTVALARARRLEDGEGDSATLAELERALATFDSAAYSRDLGSADLDEALAGAQRAAAVVRRHYSLLAQALRNLTQSLPGAGRRAWVQ